MACLPTTSPRPSPITTTAGIEEIFFDYNQNGAYDLNDDPAVYNGKLCPEEGDGVWCSRELVHVRDSSMLLLTPSQSGRHYFNLAEGSRLRGQVEEGGIYRLYISDIFNNPPVAGDTLTVETSGDCELLTKSSVDLVDTLRPGAYTLPIEVEGPGEEGSTDLVRTGTITITLETERGGKSEVAYSCYTRGEAADAGGAGDGLVVGGG